MSAQMAETAEPIASRRDWVAVAKEIAAAQAPRSAEHDRDDSFVAEAYAALRSSGLTSAGIPVELGGGGADHAEMAEVLRVLARGCPSTALAFAMHTHPLMMTVWRWRHDQAPVEPLLRKVAAERLVLVSSGGSDWLPGGGTAERVEGGYRITATKAFASGSPAGDLLMTSAVLDDPEQGATVLHFGLPLKAPGVRLVDTWRALGMRGTGSGDVVVEGAFVPDAAIGVRRPAGQWHRLFHIIAMVSFPLIYAVYRGIGEAARDAALARAAKRAHDPDAILLVGEMETALLEAQLAHDEMLRLAVDGEPGPAVTARVFAAKALLTRSLLRLVDRAMTIAGGAGFRRDGPLERLFRDIQGARFHPVPEMEQRRLAGRVALGLPLDPPANDPVAAGTAR